MVNQNLTVLQSTAVFTTLTNHKGDTLILGQIKVTYLSGPEGTPIIIVNCGIVDVIWSVKYTSPSTASIVYNQHFFFSQLFTSQSQPGCRVRRALSDKLISSTKEFHRAKTTKPDSSGPRPGKQWLA